MVVLNKKKKHFWLPDFQDECSPHEHWRGVTSLGCDKAKNNNRNNSMFWFGLRLKWTEHNNTAAIWSGRTNEASEADFLLSSFSYFYFFFFVKKVSWDTGNKWIFLQTERGGGGVVVGFWEEFTASAARSSMKGRTSIHFIFFFFLQSSTACRSCGCRHRQFGNFTGPHITFSGMSVSSHPWTPCTRARHRCRQEKALQQVIGHHQLKKKKNRNSTVWTLAHTNSQHDNTYQPMQN